MGSTWIPIASGLAPLAFGLWRFCAEIRPRFWPQVMGTIIFSRIERRRQTYYGNIIYDYLPVFEFEFEYNGLPCQSVQHGISTSFVKSEQDAEALRLRYPVGTSVTVFVNPRNPRRACLQHGIS